MGNSSLEAGEKIAAEGATAPRVTLDSMKRRVVGECYFTGYDALKAAGQDAARGVINPSTVETLTICLLFLDNGWMLIGKSAPVSNKNFSAEKGRHFAYDDALKQLWPLEGYLLREKLYLGDFVLSEPDPAAVQEMDEPIARGPEPDKPLSFDD